MNTKTINELTSKIISAAIEVHSILGPGLLEKMYERALVHELTIRGIKAVAQYPIYPKYKGITLSAEDGQPFKLDILVEDEVILELKSVEVIKDVHRKQLHTYLKLENKKVGLLINFNVPKLVDGLHRLVNNLQE